MSKKKKQPTFVLFQEGSRYILVSDESPNGFKGSLFVAWEGETPDNLTETIKTTNQIQALQRIELTSISAEWQAAFTKKAGLSIPKTAPVTPAIKPVTEPATEPVTPVTDPYVRMAPLCVTWVWAFGIATVIAILFGAIR